MNKIKIDYGQEIKLKDIANLLGISERQVQRLALDNVIKKNDKKQYLFLESLRGYIEYLENKNNAPADLKEEKIKEEIARIKKDTELKNIKIKELKNQLHSSDIVKEVMSNMLINMKGKLLSIANKLAPQIIALDNLGEIQDTIHSEVLETLTELSEYSPEMFKSKNFVEMEEEEIKENEPQKRGRKKKNNKSV